MGINEEKKDEVKRSYGIACFIDNKLVVVKRRYSYPFFDLVWGKYTLKNMEKFKSMFNRMSATEKKLIKTFNFDVMWIYIWGDIPDKYIPNKFRLSYEFRKSIFDKNFSDIKENIENRNLLMKIIDESDTRPDCWEIPKGKKEMISKSFNVSTNSLEKDYECAIREFMEETNMRREDFEIISTSNVFKYEYKRNGTTYEFRYYLAEAKNIDNIKINMANADQVNEIEEVAVMSLYEIKGRCSSSFYKLCEEIFSVRNNKKRKKIRRITSQTSRPIISSRYSCLEPPSSSSRLRYYGH